MKILIILIIPIFISAKWFLVGNSTNVSITPKQIKDANISFDSIWLYRDGEWKRYPHVSIFEPLNEIKSKEGVWFYSKDDNFKEKWENLISSYETANYNRNFHRGWQLLSSQKNNTISSFKIFNSNIESIWVYSSNEWRYYGKKDIDSFKKLEYIQPNEGFWLYSYQEGNISLLNNFEDIDDDGFDDDMDYDEDGVSNFGELQAKTNPFVFTPNIMDKDPYYKDMDLIKSKDINLSLEKTWKHFLGKPTIKIGIVDSGILSYHPDLKDNLDINHSIRYPSQKGVSDPTGYEGDPSHGTICAGIAAARGFNDIGIRGIAPFAKLVSYNVFYDSTDASFIEALSNTYVDVSSNSWGWSSDDFIYDPAIEGVIAGINNGRDKKGIIYVFAAGNEGGDANTNGSIHNSKYVMCISAIDKFGKKASYSNFGANIFLAAPGGTKDEGIVSTSYDNSGNPTYIFPYEEERGTSFSTPVVAGIAALVLQANKNLTWRDVQYILASTANKNDPTSSLWQTNGAGFHIHPYYGFGTPNAYLATKMALNFKGLPKEKISKKYDIEVQKIIPDNDISGVESSIVIDENISIEHVDVWVTTRDPSSSEGDNSLEHHITRLDDLKITLTSPYGTTVVLDYPNLSGKVGNIQNWRYGTHHFMGENSKGKWKLKIEDNLKDYEGVLSRWSIQFSGH